MAKSDKDKAREEALRKWEEAKKDIARHDREFEQKYGRR